MADSSNLTQTYTPGSDIAAGYNLSQIIWGRAGNDTILGYQPLKPSPGQEQHDAFIGDLALDDQRSRQWSNTFILGDSTQSYYTNGDPLTFGLNDFASILDFNPAQDFVQLHGNSNDYQLVNVGLGEVLLQQQPTGLDAVGFFLGSTDLNLDGNYFQYEGDTPSQPVAPQIQQLGSSGFDLSASTATDPDGNVYIVGGTTGSSGGDNAGLRDALVTKYDSQGNLLWTKEFGTTRSDTISSIAVDNQGNFYLAGLTEGDLAGSKQATVSDSWVAKYDSNGNQQWIQQFGEASISQAYSIAVDDNSNVFVSGITVGPSDASFVQDNAWVTKYDTNGSQQWFTNIGVPDSFTESYGLTVGNDGSVYATGWTLGDLAGQNAGQYDNWVGKLDNNTGQVQWVNQSGTSDYEWSWSNATDSQGNVYTTGWTLGDLGGPNAGSYDAFLSKYDSQGNQLWTQQFGTSGDDEAFHINIDSNDNIFLTGYTDGNLGGTSAGSSDAWVAKYDTNGNQAWITQFGTPEIEQAYGITSDNTGNLYVTGVTEGSLGAANAGSFDSWVAKLDAASGTLEDFGGTPSSVNTSPVLNASVSNTGDNQLTNQVSDTGNNQLTDQQLTDFIGSFFQEFSQDNNLQLYASVANDSLNGATSNDLLSTIYGNDSISGGDNTIYGHCGNDTLYGESNNNLLYGKGGDDILYGGEGNNKLYGEDGNDTLYGGADNNILDGGEGNNLIYGGEGQNTVLAGAGNDEIYTSTGNDIISAGDGNNLIHAGKGKNTIATGAGNDTIYTRAGNDFIYAGAGDDLIYAGRGDNIIYGGTGNNTIHSGRGHDLFVLTPGEGASTISHFDINKDLLGLTDGLTFDQLSITQGTNGNEFFTQVGIANSDDLLATLNWVQADTITSSSFTFV